MFELFRLIANFNPKDGVHYIPTMAYAVYTCMGDHTSIINLKEVFDIETASFDVYLPTSRCILTVLQEMKHDNHESTAGF